MNYIDKARKEAMQEVEQELTTAPASQEARTPIVVDIALAMKQLEDNPELGRMMNELVVGKVVADQLAAADKAITDLVAMLREVKEKGLIYWEAQSSRGYIAKQDMFARIDTLLAQHGGA